MNLHKPGDRVALCIGDGDGYPDVIVGTILEGKLGELHHRIESEILPGHKFYRLDWQLMSVQEARPQG